MMTQEGASEVEHLLAAAVSDEEIVSAKICGVPISALSSDGRLRAIIFLAGTRLYSQTGRPAEPEPIIIREGVKPRPPKPPPARIIREDTKPRKPITSNPQT